MQMFLTLVATVFAGLAGAGIAMLLRRASGGRLPKWLTPVGAGAAMLAATISQEYSWYQATLDAMPDDTVVIVEREQQAWWQPWTFVQPFVQAFIAFQPSETTETAAGSGILVAQTQIRERWQPGVVKPVLVDCGGNRRAELFPTTEFDEEGHPTNADWLTVPEDDALIRAVCGEAAS